MSLKNKVVVITGATSGNFWNYYKNDQAKKLDFKVKLGIKKQIFDI